MAKISQYHSNDCAQAKGCGCPWRLDYRPQGIKGPRKRLEFPTKKAAERHHSETSHKVTRGEYVDPRACPTFAVAAEAWFASKTDRRPSHVADLRSRLDTHIIPRIGAERLDRISVTAIEKLRDSLRANDYAPRTINTIIRIIGAVFEAAIRRAECGINPVKRIERTFMAARELGTDDGAGRADESVNPESILAPGEVSAMLSKTAPGLYRALFTTAALTGARSGELFALRWADVEMPKDAPVDVFAASAHGVLGPAEAA